MSKATNKEGTKIINAITIGNNPVHINCINWSYRNLGRVALNHTNKKQNKQVLIPNTIDCRLINVLFTIISGIK